MNIIGVACEFNPFHNGHEYLLMMSRRELGDESVVVCAMSGDFVQRGESAIYSKHARAEAACRCGADIVVELPLPWALSSAEGFARGSVGLLSALGVTELCFGSEAGELEPLDSLAQIMLEPAFNSRVKDKLREDPDLSYAAARQSAAEERLGELSEQLRLPNNILAVEYIKAIYDQCLKLKPVTVQRYGSQHDSADEKSPLSSSELRRMLALGQNVRAHVPLAAETVYQRELMNGRDRRDKSLFEMALLSRLRMFDEAYYNSLPDCADGLGNRICRAAHSESCYDAILAAAKTKRYPLARIRRSCMCAAAGITRDMNLGTPPYARILAANSRGTAYLRDISEKSVVPVITKPSKVKELGDECVRLFSVGANAHDFYVLGYRAEQERKGGNDWREGPKIVDNAQINSQ